MPAPAQNLYIDTFSGQFVAGVTNTNNVGQPNLFQGDAPVFNIYLLQRTNQFGLPGGAQYTIMSNAGLQLQVVIATKKGTGNTIYTQQLVWTADAGNQFFTASLPLNTAAITTLLDVNASATAYLVIGYLSGGVQTTVLEMQVTIQANPLGTAAANLPAGLTPLSLEQADARYLGKAGVNAIYLVDQSTGKLIALIAKDGELQTGQVN